jgi:hypothetical protein
LKFYIWLGRISYDNLERKNWLCGTQCQNLIKPCNGSCATNFLLINCAGMCERRNRDPLFYQCKDECLHISRPCNGKCFKAEWIINCDGACEKKPRTYLCNGQCLESHQTCNNKCPIHETQKCMDQDICINLKEQCKIFDGFEIKSNPLKNCLVETYNLQHLCNASMVIENNTLKTKSVR